MRVLIATYGTEGDIRPYVALARGLQRAGHEVAVCTADSFAGLVEGAGVPLLGFGDELYQATREVMANASGVLSTLAQARVFPRLMRQSFDRQWAAAQEFRPDVVVYHPKPLAPPSIAEKLDVPAVAALPLPMYTPTTAFGSAFLPAAPRPLWPAAYWLGRVSAGAYVSVVNDFRRGLGLRPLPPWHDELVQPDGSPRHVLYPFSPQLVPRPADYPPTAHVTGYWFLDAATGYVPDERLAAFLGEGRPDLYLGFGSMAFGRVREQRTAVVREALARTGLRAVVGTGWGGLDPDGWPAHVLAVGSVPHDWLFERVRAVVHHGGAGTTGAGLRAGRPALVCPVLADQPFWGERLHRRGLGPEPLPA
ncbi:glycosyltransferase, partial [Desertihabitans aurantiacus]|uniref:glycosyltransferase n=1 Tax=Desertihabitans aurantiacus TaxID=2282477 RepID=UPI0013001E5F